MQRFHYDDQADAVYDTATGVGIRVLEMVSDYLSPSEADAALDFMNARDERLTFESLYPLLQADEQSCAEAEAAAQTAAPGRYQTFRIIRDADCEIRIIFGNSPVPVGARVLVRWAFEAGAWVAYDA